MIRALLLSAILAQDAGVKYPVFHVGNDARISEGFGEAVPVPPGYYVPQQTWTHMDDEYRRLQWAEQHPPDTKIGPEGVIISVVVGLLAGMALGAGVALAAAHR